MYEALSGKKPWSEADTLGQLIVAICTTELPPLSEVAPWVEPGLAAVVDRGVRRDPSARWPTVAALAKALERHAGGDDIRRTMLAAADKTPRSARRGAMWLLAAAAAIACGVAVWSLQDQETPIETVAAEPESPAPAEVDPVTTAEAEPVEAGPVEAEPVEHSAEPVASVPPEPPAPAKTAERPAPVPVQRPKPKAKPGGLGFREEW